MKSRLPLEDRKVCRVLTLTPGKSPVLYGETRLRAALQGGSPPMFVLRAPPNQRTTVCSLESQSTVRLSAAITMNPVN